MRFNIKDWSYNGEKLANPLLILIRIILYPIYWILLSLTCIAAWITFGKFSAESLWEEGK